MMISDNMTINDMSLEWHHDVYLELCHPYHSYILCTSQQVTCINVRDLQLSSQFSHVHIARLLNITNMIIDDS